MKKEQLYEVLGEIDETYISNAKKPAKKPVLEWFAKAKWQKLGALAASFCLLLVSAFIVFNNMFPGPTLDEAKYAYILTYAGWTEDTTLYENSLNYEMMQNEQTKRFPIFKIDTFEELEQFKTTYGNKVSFNQGYDNVLSFFDAMSRAQYDREIFYEEHTLLIVYIPSNSSSYRYSIKEIKPDKTSICVHIEQANKPEEITEEKAGWFVCVKADKEEINNYTNFDAVFYKK